MRASLQTINYTKGAVVVVIVW